VAVPQQAEQPQQTQNPTQNATGSSVIQTLEQKKALYQPLSLRQNTTPTKPSSPSPSPFSLKTPTQPKPSPFNVDLVKQRLQEQQLKREREKEEERERARQQEEFAQHRLAEIHMQIQQQRSSNDIGSAEFLEFQASWLPQIFDPDYPMDYGNMAGHNGADKTCHLIREDSFALSMRLNAVSDQCLGQLEKLGIYGMTCNFFHSAVIVKFFAFMLF
jgi:hypothetical protein